jgi:hypothetical protein
MLRPFNADPLVPERWPARLLQDVARPRAPPQGFAPKSVTAVASVHVPDQDAVSTPGDVRVRQLDAAEPGFDGLRKLALRFFASPRTSACAVSHEVVAIHEVTSQIARSRFAATKASLIGGKHPAVTKFMPFAPPAVAVETCAVPATAAVELPLGVGPAFILPNIYNPVAAPAWSVLGGQSSSPMAASPHHGGTFRVVLCEAALGALCVRPTEVFTGTQRPGGGAATAASGREALRSRGFDSAALRLGDDDFIVVFDPAQLLPTHVFTIAATAPPGETRSTSASVSEAPSAVVRAPSPGASTTPGGSAATSPSAGLRTAFLRSLSAAEEAVASDGAKLQALIRRQCADLEDAVRARREWLLAAARREEAQALLRLQQRRSAPGLVTAGHVAALDAHPSALRGLTVDTSRVLSGIDNLALRPAAQHQQQNQRVAPSSPLAQGQPHIDGSIATATDQGTAPRADALATAARKRPVEAEVAAPLSLPSPRNAPSVEPQQQAAVSNRAPTLNRPSVAGRGGGAAVRPATSGGGPSSPLDPRYYRLAAARPATRSREQPK